VASVRASSLRATSLVMDENDLENGGCFLRSAFEKENYAARVFLIYHGRHVIVGFLFSLALKLISKYCKLYFLCSYP